jgi:hypothetical protein
LEEQAVSIFRADDLETSKNLPEYMAPHPRLMSDSTKNGFLDFNFSVMDYT